MGVSNNRGTHEASDNTLKIKLIIFPVLRSKAASFVRFMIFLSVLWWSDELFCCSQVRLMHVINWKFMNHINAKLTKRRY